MLSIVDSENNKRERWQDFQLLRGHVYIETDTGAKELVKCDGIKEIASTGWWTLLEIEAPLGITKEERGMRCLFYAENGEVNDICGVASTGGACVGKTCRIL